MGRSGLTALGILGGTFDPPHIGHLLLAESALDNCGLSKMLMVPAADPPHKRDNHVTGIEHRLAMLKLAIVDNPRLELSTVDIDRPGPHYTVDMLDIIGQQYPGSELYFAMGDDSLNDLTIWRDPAGILARAWLIVMARTDEQVDLSKLRPMLPNIDERVVLLRDVPIAGVSSTRLRERIHNGLSVRYQLPQTVEHYIAQHQLYA